MKLASLLAGYPLKFTTVNLPTKIHGFSADSRKIKPGYLYICIRGENEDGHGFVQQAVEQGASVIVSQKFLQLSVPIILVEDTRHFLSFFADSFFNHPSQKIQITGITGTNGKTTTAHYLHEIYQAAEQQSALMGTCGVKTRQQYRQTQCLTTPGAEELHNILWQLQLSGVQQLAMEVSSHALVQKRVEHCRFHAAIFTNLTREHLDYHQTMDDYFAAKAHLFALLAAREGNAIINADDKWAIKLTKQIAAPFITFGLENKADVRAEKITSLTKGGSVLNVASPWGKLSFTLYLPGLYNIYNALGAATAALMDNLTLQEVTKGLEALRVVPGRLELLPSPPGVQVYVDYAHTPDGLEKVLQTVTAYPHHRIILVFGCRGRRDRGKRPAMGVVADHYADIVVLTTDNPVEEDPETIAQDITSAMQKKPIFLADRQEAIHYALAAASDGDIVLITGKGREDYQLVGAATIPYSDLHAVESFVNSMH
ncbi:MAG TPA: UDP-N-acetylmuramoyl-L-alanyl-D-glutamate--2,6-diaminopimelate ligase [Oscillospiraceae bacterium]|nr:UDP-N-acetylmuramoyl-L-alanyl-D-glutamate--2,6-diaminopimelate ligase [Oscillospiraceae bacterium]